MRRIKALDLAPGARCLEAGGGRGSIARWLCEYVGPAGRVTATNLETGFLSELSLAIGVLPAQHRSHGKGADLLGSDDCRGGSQAR